MLRGGLDNWLAAAHTFAVPTLTIAARSPSDESSALRSVASAQSWSPAHTALAPRKRMHGLGRFSA